MKPIKNVLPACEGSERGYSVNRSESTLMVIGRKRDKDKTPVMSTILNLFSTSFQRHIILLEIVALANSKKNRNIKANDVNLISMARSTNFCFKTTHVGMFLRFRSNVHCFQRFERGLSPYGKTLAMKPPYSLEITAFEPPSPSEFPMTFPGGYGYFREPHTVNFVAAWPRATRDLLRHNCSGSLNGKNGHNIALDEWVESCVLQPMTNYATG